MANGALLWNNKKAIKQKQGRSLHGLIDVPEQEYVHASYFRTCNYKWRQ